MWASQMNECYKVYKLSLPNFWPDAKHPSFESKTVSIIAKNFKYIVMHYRFAANY